MILFCPYKNSLKVYSERFNIISLKALSYNIGQNESVIINMPFFVGYNILLNNENNTSLRRVRKKVVASVKRRQIQTVSEVAHRSRGQ